MKFLLYFFSIILIKVYTHFWFFIDTKFRNMWTNLNKNIQYKSNSHSVSSYGEVNDNQTITLCLMFTQN